MTFPTVICPLTCMIIYDWIVHCYYLAKRPFGKTMEGQVLTQTSMGGILVESGLACITIITICADLAVLGAI